MKRQIVVRTYPKGYTNSMTDLNERLASGWLVVSSNPFSCHGETGTEYILEKEVIEGESE